MNKFFTSMLMAVALTAFGQVEDPDVMVIHFKDGTQTTIDITNADYIDFAKAGEGETPEQPGEGDDPVIPADPKVGDYFYSDGTWSDGGLISIGADGRNAVWAEEKPAPLAGKTVVGIVFSTNPDRMAESEKAAGFTHGYVIGCKNVTDPKKKNYALYPESVWFAGEYAYINGLVQVNPVSKIASTCYNNLEGYTETNTMLEKNDPEYYYDDIPMFWYGTKAYPVKAPGNTSGWFIPSIGQVWDCVANFCSGEVADFLATCQTNSLDFTYYCSKKDLSTSPYEQFAQVFSLVPDADKDEMTIPDNGSLDNNTATINLGTSTRYDDEARVIISLGMKGCTLVEGMAAWFDEETHVRPILAF